MAEIIFQHKYIDEYGNITDIKIMKTPVTNENPEGITYSLVYIIKGKRIIGYDNFEGHKIDGNSHHKHIRKRIENYKFIDEWKLIDDFNNDVEKLKKGVIK